MKSRPGSIRNKLMLACALTAAAVLATPAAMAHDYRGHRDDSGKVLGALVVGAVIGGVIASASEHHHDYYSGGYYYPAPQAYAPAGYYESGYASYPTYGGYYSYPSYPSYGYGSSVNVGVVYSSGGSYHRGYYDGRYNRGSRYYDGSRGYYGNRGGYHHGGGQGRYYSRHGH